MVWSNKVKGGKNSSLLIAKKRIPIKKCMLLSSDLKYWKNNPRIYSIVHASDQALSQKEIQEELLKRTHVRGLIVDILFHGGLIHDIVVIDGSFEVIEGNSRLAAYRQLAKDRPVEYSKISCSVLPSDTDEKLIYAFLSQEHIKGKTEWIPYEQAGIFYRLWKDGEDPHSIAKEMNVSTRLANRFIKTYEFMVEHNEDKPSRWSYYDEYLKNRKISKKRETDKRLDAIVIDQVRKQQFTAQELRDKLPVICDNEKAYEKLASGKTDLSTTYKLLEDSGRTDDLSVKFREMHEFVNALTKEDLQSLNHVTAKHINFHIGKILTKLSTLRKQVF